MFAQLFKAYGTKRGLSLDALATETGISARELTAYTAGNRTPAPSQLDKICDALRLGGRRRRKWHRAAARAKGWRV